MGAILVTGGAGFIGSHLVERLVADGREVAVLDNFDPFYDPREKERNLAALAGHPRFRLVRGDIRDAAALDSALRASPTEAVIHLAALAGVRPSIARPEAYVSVNLDGTARVLEAARRHGVGRVLFGSSSSVYGNASRVPFSEDDPADRPISPYAATKRGGELLCHAHHEVHGTSIACLRFFTVFGPRQRPDLAIRKFAERMTAGLPLEVFGDGSMARDYTYVSDIVDGIVRALDRCRGWHLWNLGGSRPVPLAVMVEKLAAALGVTPGIQRAPLQPGDVERTWADLRRASAELGWSPRTGFDEGLGRFVEWLRAERVRAGN